MSAKKRLSLYPLSFGEALSNLVAVKPKGRRKKSRRKSKAARKKAKKKA